MTFVRGHFRRTRSGYTYVRPSIRRNSSGFGVVAVLGLVVSAALAIVAAIVRFIVQHWLPIVVILLVSGAVAVGVMLTGKLRRRYVTSYLELARLVAHGADGRYDELLRLARRIPVDDQHRIIGEEEIYTTLIAEILADGEVSDEECARLTRINEVFAFVPHRATEIRQEAFDGFVSWVGIDLTQQQEATLRDVALRLNIPQAHTDRWLSMIAGHRSEQARQAAIAAEQARQAAIAAERQRQTALEAERARQAALAIEREQQAALAAAHEQKMQEQRNAANAVHEIERREPERVDVKLKRGESCWFTTNACLRDRKMAKIGTCFVTNKRLLFVADTAVSIDLSRMLDVAADPDAGLLRIIKDGRKTPYEFALEQPLVTLAHIERSLEEANGTR